MTQAAQKGENGRQRKVGKKIAWTVVVLLIVLVLSVALLLPWFVSSEKGRTIILARINDAIEGQMDFTDLSIGWLKGIEVTDFGFKDDSGRTVIRAKQISAKAHYVSILRGDLSFGKTIIDEPSAEIILSRKPQDKSTTARNQQASDSKEAKSIGLPIKKIDLRVRNGSLKISGYNSRAAEPLLVKIHKGRFRKTSRIARTTLDGQVECEYNWSALSSVLGGFVPSGLKLQGTRKDSISFSTQYTRGDAEEIAANLNADGKIGFDKAQYLGLHFGPSEIEAQIQKGILAIKPFSTQVNNGQLRFAAEADLRAKPRLLKIPAPIHLAEDIQINDEISRMLLMYLNPIFANAFNVRGALDFDCEQLVIPLDDAGRNNLKIIGTISLKNLSLQQSDLFGQILSIAKISPRDQGIVIHPTRFVLQNGFLRYDDMQMDIDNSPFNFKGVIGMDGSLDMTITLPYTADGRTIKTDEKDAGRRISLPLKGTIDKPELDMSKLLEEQLKQQLEEPLKQYLDEQLTEKVLESLEDLLK